GGDPGAQLAAEAHDDVHAGDGRGVLADAPQRAEDLGRRRLGVDVEVEVVVGPGAHGEDPGLERGSHGRHPTTGRAPIAKAPGTAHEGRPGAAAVAAGPVGDRSGSGRVRTAARPSAGWPRPRTRA